MVNEGVCGGCRPCPATPPSLPFRRCAPACSIAAAACMLLQPTPLPSPRVSRQTSLQGRQRVPDVPKGGVVGGQERGWAQRGQHACMHGRALACAWAAMVGQPLYAREAWPCGGKPLGLCPPPNSRRNSRCVRAAMHTRAANARARSARGALNGVPPPPARQAQLPASWLPARILTPDDYVLWRRCCILAWPLGLTHCLHCATPPGGRRCARGEQAHRTNPPTHRPTNQHPLGV